MLPDFQVVFWGAIYGVVAGTIIGIIIKKNILYYLGLANFMGLIIYLLSIVYGSYSLQDKIIGTINYLYLIPEFVFSELLSSIVPTSLFKKRHENVNYF